MVWYNDEPFLFLRRSFVFSSSFPVSDMLCLVSLSHEQIIITGFSHLHTTNAFLVLRWRKL